MALTYLAADFSTGGVTAATSLASSSISYTAGQPIIVTAGYNTAVTPSISDTAGLTWTLAGSNTANGGGQYVWYTVPGASGSTVITTGASTSAFWVMRVITHAGAAGAPVNVSSGALGFVGGATSFGPTITPTTTGSALWMAINDFQSVAVPFTANAGKTAEGIAQLGSHVSDGFLRPSTQPLTSNTAVALTATAAASTNISWVAFEVAESGAAPASVNPGAFDATAVVSGWFDVAASPVGWFDVTLLQTPSGGGAVNYTLSGAAGAYTVAGQAGSFKVGHTLSGSAGAYVVSGQAGTLTYTAGSSAVHYTLSGAAGAYTVTGQAGGFKVAHTLSGSAGSYVITGNAATLALTRRLAGAAGSYAVVGQAASLKVSRALSGAAGAYVITGNAGTLTYSPGTSGTAYTLSGAAGSYLITGNTATFKKTNALSGSAGSYAITGNAASFKVGHALTGANGAYAVTGNAGVLAYTPGTPTTQHYTLAGEPGAYLVTGGTGSFGYTDNSLPTKVGGDDAPQGYKQRFQVQVKNKVHLFDTDQEAQSFLKNLPKKAQKKAESKPVAKPDAYAAMMADILDFDDEQDIEDILMLL